MRNNGDSLTFLQVNQDYEIVLRDNMTKTDQTLTSLVNERGRLDLHSVASDFPPLEKTELKVRIQLKAQ